jgi:hypothetical protein
MGLGFALVILKLFYLSLKNMGVGLLHVLLMIRFVAFWILLV